MPNAWVSFGNTSLLRRGKSGRPVGGGSCVLDCMAAIRSATLTFFVATIASCTAAFRSFGGEVFLLLMALLAPRPARRSSLLKSLPFI